MRQALDEREWFLPTGRELVGMEARRRLNALALGLRPA